MSHCSTHLHQVYTRGLFICLHFPWFYSILLSDDLDSSSKGGHICFLFTPFNFITHNYPSISFSSAMQYYYILHGPSTNTSLYAAQIS